MSLNKIELNWRIAYGQFCNDTRSQGGGGGGYTEFQVTGMNGGKNQNPNKPLDQKLILQKIPCRISET